MFKYQFIKKHQRLWLALIAGGGLFLLLTRFYFLIFPPYVPALGTGKAGLIVSNTKVDSIQILFMDSNPSEVNIVAKGSIYDPCAMVGEIKNYQQGKTFNYIITAQKPHDVVCTNKEKTFEEIIKLDTGGLKRGTYTVNVNGLTDTFTLSQDNIPKSTSF